MFDWKKYRVGIILKAFVWGVVSAWLALGVAAGSESAAVLPDKPCPAIGAKCEGLVIWPHEKSDIAPDPALTYGRLENGFRYVLMKNKEPRNRVSLHLDIQAGSLNEIESEQGLAHFLEHMLFNGSTHFKPGELVKYFQSIGMQFGPDANAHTGFNETVYDILLPDGSRQQLKDALLVLHDFAAGALLLQDEIDRERNVILAEKRARDSASYRTLEKTLAFEFPDALISKRLPIGLERVIRDVDRPRMKAFYDAWYRPDNMILVAVGDFDPHAAFDLIQQQFETMEQRVQPRSLPDIGEITHSGLKTFYHYEKEAGGTTVAIERLEKKIREPDSIAYQKRMLKKNLADRIIQYRLDRLLNQANTPVTRASIYSGVHLQEIFYAEITADCQPDNWQNALQSLEQTLRRALEYGFTETEVARVKKQALAEMDKAVKGAETRESGQLARRIIWHLNNDRVMQSPAQEKQIFGPFIETLTPEQLHAEFKHSWKNDTRLVLVTGDARIEDAPENTIRDVMTKSMETAVAKPETSRAAAFPYLEKPDSVGAIREKKALKDLGITLVDFENGVRMNIKKTDFKAGEFLVALRFGDGRSAEPPDHAGISLIAKAVLNESGTGTLEKETLQAALAGTNTAVTFQITESDMMLSGSGVPQQTELMFQLLYALLRDPGFRPEAYALAKSRLKQRYEALAHSIDGALNLSGLRFLAGGDHRFGLPPENRLFENTLSDVREWISPALASGGFEVSFVGDLEPERIIALGARYFGSLPPAAAISRKPAGAEPVFPSGDTLEVAVPTKIPKGLVDVVYPTDDFWNIQRTRRLVILAEVFSEMMRVRIREKLGATYSPFAFSKPSRDYNGYGLFHAMVHVAPDTAEKVITEVQNIALALNSGGITQDQFQRALDPVLTGIKDARRTNDYWLNSVLLGNRAHPEQLAWARNMLSDFASIQKNEIEALAKTYLLNAKAARIIVKPASEPVTR